MRQANLDTQWIHDDSGHLLGIALGHDFCAEHEDSARDMKIQFGVDDSNPDGIQSRKVKRVPNYLQFATYDRKPGAGSASTEPCAMLLLYPNFTIDQYISNPFECQLTDEVDGQRRRQVVCAWDQRFFVINVRGVENVRNLKTLYAAFQSNDIAFGSGFSRWLVQRGLTFMMPSRIPASIQQKILEADRERSALTTAFRNSGIEMQLAAGGRRWHALEPAWVGEDKTEIRCFLNPVDQHLFKSGWFSLDELAQWAEGYGPIVKGAPQKPKKTRSSR